MRRLFLMLGLLLPLVVQPVSAADTARPKPEPRVAVGKCISPTASLVRREAGGQAWKVVAQNEEVFSGDLLLAVPLAMIELKKGVRLGLLADLDGRTPFPIIETAVVLHDNSATDLDFTLDRGRVGVLNQKQKGAAAVRIRFHEEVWDLDMSEPGSRAGLEIYGRWPKGAPFTTKPTAKDVPTLDLVMLVLNGHVKLDTGCHEYRMKAPPGPALFQWDSVTGCDANSHRLEKLPPWALLEELTLTPELKKKKERVDRFRRIIIEKSIDAAIDDFLASDDVEQRRLAIFAMGALDELARLGDALLHTKLPDVWDDGVIALRHWLGRGPGQDLKFYNFLIQERKFSPGQADIVLHLLHSFSDHDRACPDCYEMLIDYLKHDKLAIRGLAHWHLQRLVPEGKKIQFNPFGTPQERALAFQEWKKLVPDGHLPPGLKEKEKK